MRLMRRIDLRQNLALQAHIRSTQGMFKLSYSRRPENRAAHKGPRQRPSQRHMNGVKFVARRNCQICLYGIKHTRCHAPAHLWNKAHPRRIRHLPALILPT